MSEYTNVVLKVQGTQEHTVIGGKYVVAANYEAPIAYVTGSDYAHLFAAAPELLETLKEIAGMETIVCQHCEGGGEFWADGKAHYPSENFPTVRCGNCGGSGRLAVDLEEVQNIACAAIAKAEGK